MTRAAATRAALLLFACSFTIADALHAQTADSGSARHAGRDSARALDAVVVRARHTATTAYTTNRVAASTKIDVPLHDTPQSVSVIPRALIADQSMQSMTDVLRYVPGVTMGQGEGHRDTPTIRGISTSADFFVDGVRDDAQYYRDLYNVDRVEVLEGANAMTFGRGGGGGAINRITRSARWADSHEATYETGSWNHHRGTLDLGTSAGPLAARLDAMLEQSGEFRDGVSFRRWGLNPTGAWMTPGGTLVRIGAEHFHDSRVVDRGIPSYLGAPSQAGIATYFGNRDSSRSRADVNDASVSVEHGWGPVTLRNRLQGAHYDTQYQNTVPGAVSDDGTQVTISGYSNANRRTNVFDQTDILGHTTTGAVAHAWFAGVELGTQRSGNFRQTAYFGNGSTSVAVPFDAPVVGAVNFRQSSTDADNRVVVGTGAAYVQDQATLDSHVQVVGGVRYDRFSIHYRNNRNGSALSRTDGMLSPRAGLIVQPFNALSLYASYSVSHLPSAGDQFSSLTVTTQALEPEAFTNREVGAKWDATESLALTGALYQLDRNNSQAPDPADPTHIVQTGAQRTVGWQLQADGSLMRRWDVVAGFTSQLATVVSRTTAALPGARVPLVPRTSASLWNRLRATNALSLGFGVVRQAEMFAAIDNTVRLPAFTRMDAAAIYDISPALRAQLNVENLFDARYYPTSQGNNNIMPGAPRTIRLTLTAH